METVIRNIIVLGIVLMIIAGLGYFILTRTGMNPGGQVANNADTTPLSETPAPTFYPIATATPLAYVQFATPSSSPSARPSATPTVAGMSKYTCTYLSVSPATGTAPLNVKLTAQKIVNTGREFEFDLGDGNVFRQKGLSITHKYEKAGDFTAVLTVRDENGNKVVLSEDPCRTSITITEKPTATSSATSKLPDTGVEDWVWISLIPATAIGYYLFKKYKFA